MKSNESLKRGMRTRQAKGAAKKALLCMLMFALAFGSLLPMAAADNSGDTPIVLLPTDDAIVSASNPDTNYGGTDNHDVAHSGHNDPRNLYLKFNLQGVDLTGVMSGTLRLYNNDTRYNRIIAAYETAGHDTSWEEGTLNWNNAPAPGPVIAGTDGSPAEAQITMIGNNDDRELGSRYYDLDVSGYIAQGEDGYLSIIVQSNGYTRFASKENQGGVYSPQLVLARGTSGGEEPVSVTLNATDDAYISSLNPDTNHNTPSFINQLEVADSNNANERKIYLKFDLSGVDLAEIRSGKLRLYNNDTRYGRVVVAYETAGNDTSWDEDTLTWNNAPAAGPSIQATGGGLASADIPNLGTTADTREQGAAYYELDVFNYISKADENGLLSIIVQSNGYTRFASKENNGGANPPQLVLSDQVNTGPIGDLPRELGENGRSMLYPEDWYPGYGDDEGRFLHDFSYAGYRMGEAPIPNDIPGEIYDVTQAPYSADNTGEEDATSMIQQAINDAGDAGGGVVYLPAGTYRIKPQGASNESLRISQSGVVLRGAGPGETFLFNDEPVMRAKDIIAVTSEGGGFQAIPGTETLVRVDLPDPTVHIPVQDVSGFAVGDWIVINNKYTAEFIAEHDMTGWWNFYEGQDGITFYRKIIDIDASSNTIVIDIPTRYPVKTRDFTSVHKMLPPVTEVGVEHMSIGNVENLTPGIAEEDNSREGTAGFQVAGNKVIRFIRVADSWARNVHSYRPPTNSAGYDYHILTNGITTSNTRNVTIMDTDIRKPLFRGAGGNGYIYELVGNDNLIVNANAEEGRHNYTFSHMRTSGNVIRNSVSRNPSLVIDFHQYLSASNLLEGMLLDGDRIEASVRPYPSSQPNYKHGVTTSQTVIWNTYGERAYSATDPVIVDSRQFGHGYIIGTSGNDTGVRVTPTRHSNRETAPVDFVEGLGQGHLLQPQSLHQDQLDKRTDRKAVDLKTIALNGVPLAGFQPGKKNYDVVLPYGTADAPIVAAKPLSSGSTVTILQAEQLPGAAVIQVASPGGATEEYTLNLSAAASPAVLEQISLLPDRTRDGWKFGLKLDSGTSAWLQVTGMMSDGREADLAGAEILYSSANEQVLTVSGAGQIAAISPGTANVTVKVALGGVQLERTIAIVSAIPVFTERESIPIVSVGSSSDDGNIVENIIDNDYDTRWSASGDEQWAMADLGEVKRVGSVSIAFFNGHTRKAIFDLEVSVDGEQWTTVYERNPSGNSGGATSVFEWFEMDKPHDARYVRYVGFGNNVNAWNSISEFRVHPGRSSGGGDGDGSDGGGGSGGGNGGGGSPTAPVETDSESVTVKFPATGAKVVIESEFATIEAPGDLLSGQGVAADDEVTFVFAAAATELINKMSERTKRAIGNRTIVEIQTFVNGKQIVVSNPDAPVTVRLPYAPSDEELANPALLEKLTVWQIDNNGVASAVPNAKYDAASGSVIFKTTGLSRFAIVLEPRTFGDLGTVSWARHEIEVLASRGVINGMSETVFAPTQNIRRADFTKLLVQALGLSATAEVGFEDVAAGEYYAAEVAIAAKLGIVNGFGDGTFRPGAHISRQDMMVIIARALREAGKLGSSGAANLDERFADASDVAPYARGDIAALVELGLVQGSAGRLNPEGTATRAEAAALLFRLLKL